MKKPERKEYLYHPMSFEDANHPEYKHGFNVGFNRAHDEWEAYIKDIGGITECMLLHEQGCQCQNDE